MLALKLKLKSITTALILHLHSQINSHILISEGNSFKVVEKGVNIPILNNSCLFFFSRLNGIN